MQKNNILIETWKKGADAIATAYKMFGKDYQTKLKNLASNQLIMIYEDRPNKEKTVDEQCNDEQLEFIKYLRKVATTEEIEQ